MIRLVLLLPFCTAISFLPPAIKVLKTGDTKSLSLGLYIIFVIGVNLCLAYGIAKHYWPITIANTVTLLFAIIILAFIVKNTIKLKKFITINTGLKASVASALTSQYNLFRIIIGSVMLAKLCQSIDKTNAFIGKLVAYGTLLMALIMFSVVALRYGFNLGWIAMQESITYLHAAVFLLGSAYTYQQNGHVRVDVFYRGFSRKGKTRIDLCGCLFLMLPVSLYIAIACWPYVIESWQLLEGSREPGGLPFLYVLKSFLLIFSITMVLQSISEILKHSMTLFAKNKAL